MPSLIAILAKQKKLPLTFLKSFGIKDYRSGISIPYLLSNGTPARGRLRLGLSSKDGFRWIGNGEMAPYGVWKLVQNSENDQKLFKRSLTLVEGESDTWTMWFHGFDVLGIPGSTCVKFLKSEHLSEIQTVFIWQEPDKGGEIFISGIAKRLFEIGFMGKAKILKFYGYKDPSEIHIKQGNQFKKIMEYLMMTALPLPPYISPAHKVIKKFTVKKGDLTEDQILHARKFPLEKLLEVKIGKKIICPAHDDQMASLYIKGYGFCFACGYHVDSIGWLMHKGMVFREAVLSLQ